MALFPVPGSSRGKSPSARLAFYSVLTVICVCLAYSMRNFSRGKSGITKKEYQQYHNADPVKGQPDPLATLEPHKRLLKSIIGADIGDTGNDASKANDLANYSTAIEYSFSFLKGRQQAEIKKLTAENKNLTFVRLMSESNKWRGSLVHFYGILLHKEVIAFPELPRGLQKLWKLTLADPYMAHFYTVLTPRLSSMAKIRGAVAVDGLFLRRYAYWCKPDPKRKGFWQWTPLLIAPELYSTWEPFPRPPLLTYPKDKPFQLRETVKVLDKSKLEQIMSVSKSGSEIRSIGPVAVKHEKEVRRLQDEKEALEHLFAYVNGFSDEELKQKVDKRMTFENLMVGNQAPAWAKWKIAQFEGRARYVESHEIKGLKSGIKRIYVLIAYDSTTSDFSYRWSLATLNLPPGLREGDRIRARGVFVKLYPYKSISNEWYWTPLLVVSGIEKVKFVPGHAPKWIYVLVTLLLVLLIWAWYFFSKKDAERSAGIRRTSKDRRAVRDVIRAVKKGKSLERGKSCKEGDQSFAVQVRSVKNKKELSEQERIVEEEQEKSDEAEC